MTHENMKKRGNKQGHSRLHFERGGNLLKCKRSQITIFIIIALILVVTIALIFVLAQKPTVGISASKPDSSKAYITKCVKDATAEAEGLIIPNGGFLELSSENSVRFNGINVLWLCYTADYESTCINKHPMLQREIEKEIESYIKPKIESCFANVKTNLKNYGYKEEPLYFNVKILPTKIHINITKKISYHINEQEINIEKFDSSLNSPLYNFISIANEAVNQELRDCDCSQTCNADIFELNRLNPYFEIIKPTYGGNGQEIYVIKEINSGKEFNFAVRNCVPEIPGS